MARFHKPRIPALSLYKLCDLGQVYLITEPSFFQLNLEALPRYTLILSKGALEILCQ